MKRALVAVFVAALPLACGATRVSPSPPSADASPPPPDAPPTTDAGVSNDFASLEHLRGLLAADALATREQHALTGAGSGVEWRTVTPSPVCLRLAAAGPYTVLVDGKRQADGVAPAEGALVPAKGPLCVPAGELRVVGAPAGRIVIAFGAL